MNKVLIIKQVQNEDVWKKIRNLAWFSDKKLFAEVERLTYDIIEESKGEIKFKHEK
jgi:hypothetical protein